jgi:ACS family hexuronate transporter-like MFS transporter
MVGAVAGIVSNKILGTFLDQAENTAYFWAFLIAGLCYLIVLLIIHLLMPKMIPFNENLEKINE